MIEIEHDNRHQHEQGAEEGVEEEFHRSVDPPWPAPNPYEESHGYQHRLPEDVEEKEIEGDEDPEHARLQQEQKDVEFLRTVGDGSEARGDGQHAQQGSEEDEKEAYAVDSHVVANT